MKEIQGELAAKNKKFGIVVARFNEFINKNLLEGALDGLKRHGAKDDQITVAWVPGAFEIPLMAQTMAQSGQYDAVICLGCVIRGATAHFDFIAGQAASGIAKAALETGVPVVFGVLTPDTIEQALERAGTKSGNKGFDAAMTAIEMANVLEKLADSGIENRKKKK